MQLERQLVESRPVVRELLGWQRRQQWRRVLGLGLHQQQRRVRLQWRVVRVQQLLVGKQWRP
jgi:hypothetical protein